MDHKGFIRTSIYCRMVMSSLVAALSVVATSCTASGVIPHASRESRRTCVIAMLELMASLPPFKITALPALKQSAKASAVTLGRDS